MLPASKHLFEIILFCPRIRRRVYIARGGNPTILAEQAIVQLSHADLCALAGLMILAVLAGMLDVIYDIAHALLLNISLI
jgi:hypothetical protein